MKRPHLCSGRMGEQMDELTAPPAADSAHPAEPGDVGTRIRWRLSRMPPQVRRAAVYALAHADAVAFMSVRELAASAGVAPASVIRLARAADYASFADFRAGFRARLQRRAGGDAPAPGAGDASEPETADLARPDLAFRQSLDAVSDAILEATTVFVVGFRSAYAFAHYLVYLGRMAMPKFRLVDPALSSVEAHLAMAEADDLVIVYSVAPYSTEAVQLVGLLAEAGIATVAITDSIRSPVAAKSRYVLEVPRRRIGQIHSMAGCLSVSEILLADCFRKLGKTGARNIAEFERRVRRLSGYWQE